MFNIKSVGLTLVIACVTPLLLAGCSQGSDNQVAEQTGTLRSELATVGSDGATYEFPPGSFAIIQGPLSGQLVALDGPDQVLEHSLPVGSFSIDLLFTGDGAPRLNRTQDGTTTLVDVNWVDTHPIPFDVLQNATTDLTLHFHADTLGDITFENGNLDLRADVQNNTVTSVGSIEFDGSVAFSSETYADPSAPYATGLDVSDVESFVLLLQPTSDWQIGPGTVCRSASLTSFGFSSTGMGNRLAEEASEQQSICVFDEGDSDEVQVFSAHLGAAPPEQASFLPNSDYDFQLLIDARVGDVFDGVTLRQSAFANLSVPSGFFGHTVSEDIPLAEASGAVSGTIRMKP